jgi:hypothetical protein
MVCEKKQAIYPGSGSTRPYFQQKGNEAYIIRTEVPIVGVSSTRGEGKSPSP